MQVISDYTAECVVLDAGNNAVLKIYHRYPRHQVEQMADLQAKYAKIGLAPPVLSPVRSYQEGYGYKSAYVKVINGNEKQIDDLAYQLGVVNKSELPGNIGLRDDGKLVLFDWGVLTLCILGITESNVWTT